VPVQQAPGTEELLLYAQERLPGMPVDTLVDRFHNRKGVGNLLKDRHRSLEQALEEAVSRALRDNLAPLQRTADELHQAYADLVAACSSSRPSNALPAMLRAQTAASALAAGLSVLSNFVAVALKPREANGADEQAESHASSVVAAEPELEYETPVAAALMEPRTVSAPPMAEYETPVPAAVSETSGFDVSSLSSDLQDLHRRANRVAKVAMQDIKLLQPKDVRLARENKDICTRLRTDLDKARKEYDRRFRAIQDHPVDYFHHWLVEILAEGDTNALGEYPYPSPVLHR
jgi:hypothetical protein